MNVLREVVLPTPVEAPGSARDVMVSVLVPVTERPHDLVQLYREFVEPLRSISSFEFVFVLEPWYRSLGDGLLQLAKDGEPVRVVQADQTMGEAKLLKIAAEQCRGRIVVTLPAYPRVVASSLSTLIERVEQGADVAVARRCRVTPI